MIREGGELLAQVTCFWCKVKEDKTSMIQETNKKYYHVKNCHSLFLADKEFKKKEFDQKLELSMKIAEVYGLESYKLIPSTFYTYLEDVRNDNTLFGRLGIKNSKKGVAYSGISYTYEFCKETIREVHRTKEFKNFQMELRYGLAIIKNNLIDARNDALQKLKLKNSLDITKSVEYVSVEVVDDVATKYVKHEIEDDISDLLD